METRNKVLSEHENTKGKKMESIINMVGMIVAFGQLQRLSN